MKRVYSRGQAVLHTTSPSSSLALDATSPSRGGLGRRFIFRSIRLSAPKPSSAARQNVTPAGPSVAKRQPPKTRRYAKGSPTRGAVAAKHATERLYKVGPFLFYINGLSSRSKLSSAVPGRLVRQSDRMISRHCGRVRSTSFRSAAIWLLWKSSVPHSKWRNRLR